MLEHFRAELGDGAAAAEAYQQTTAILSLAPATFDWHIELLSGQAGVALVQGRREQALGYAQALLTQLETYPAFPRTVEPLRIYLICYRVLRANEDRRAKEVLRDAQRLLLERAAKIEDPGLRRSFLEDVDAHRDLLAAFDRAQIP